MSRLHRDMRQTLTGNMAYALSQWAVLIIVARWGSPDQVGFLTLATAVATPIFVLAGLSLREARAVDFGSAFEGADYFGLRALTMAGGLLLSALVILWLGQDGPAAFIVVGLAVVITKLPHEQAVLHYGFCQKAGRFDLIQRSQLARAAIGVGAFVVVFATTKHLPAALAAQAIAWAAIIVLMDLPGLRSAGITTSWKGTTRARMLTLLRWVLPLALSSAVAVAVMSAPRVVLSEYADFAELGLFGAIFYFLTANQLLITAVSQASASRLARAYDAGERTDFTAVLVRVLALNLAAGAIVLLGAWSIGEWIVTAMYGPEYANHFLIMAVATVGAIQFASVIARFALNAVKRFGLTLGMNLATFAVALGVAFWLVPTRGAEGAAIAAIAAEATRLVLGAPLLLRVISRMPR